MLQDNPESKKGVYCMLEDVRLKKKPKKKKRETEKKKKRCYCNFKNQRDLSIQFLKLLFVL